MTFSIVGYDADEKAWGVAVASKFLAVGAIVPHARTGVGAVATQALGKISFGPDGLALMAQGKSAQETLAELLAADTGREHRQLGVVDRHGGSAAHTGSDCYSWAGHLVGEGFTCQGNILTGADVVDAMADAYTSASGELADRLMAALIAGDRAGGDSRGRQSAALIVARPNQAYSGDNDRYVDLRVDDDPVPVTRLNSLLTIHHLYFGKPDPTAKLVINDVLARELQAMLRDQNYYSGEINGVWDVDSKASFWAMIGSENLEERWNIEDEPDTIDPVALNYLRERFSR